MAVAAAGGARGADEEEEQEQRPGAVPSSPPPLLRARKSDVFDSEGFQAVAFINQIYPDGVLLF